MGETCAVVVAGPIEEDLGFVFKAAEGGGMDDAGDVALILAAPTVDGLRMPSAAGRRGLLREWGKKVLGGDPY
jgi:hypothetical protein